MFKVTFNTDPREQAFIAVVDSIRCKDGIIELVNRHQHVNYVVSYAVTGKVTVTEIK